MEHGFYTKTKSEQNRILGLIAFCALAVILVSIFISWKTGIYLVPILAFPIVLSIIAPFFDTPSLKKRKKLIYHSSLFLTEAPKNGVIILHGGTLFDYVFVIDKKMHGKQRTTFILQQYLQGLLCLIEQYKNTTQKDLKIRGTSYILNKRTAERIGFRVISTDFIQNLILIYNYFNILIMNSIAKDRLVFPNLKDTITFEANLNDLIERKAYIESLNNKLKSSVANNVRS